MLSRNVGNWPYGGSVPPPPPPLHTDPEQPAGESGMPPAARFTGRDDTLAMTGQVGAGDAGYTGRDPFEQPYPEGRGLFGRLHEGTGDE